MTFADEFVELIQTFDTSQYNLFNPYTDICPFFDHLKSAEIRTANLKLVLEQIDKFDTLLVGEAPGPHGCRKSGIAFLDEVSYPLAEAVWGIEGLQIATVGGPHKEQSAQFIWGELKWMKNPPLLWNIIPMHPFKASEELTIRTPKKSDYKFLKPMIDFFFSNTEFEKIIPIGRVSEKYLSEMGFEVEYVRHPANGGATKFRQGWTDKNTGVFTKGMRQHFEYKDTPTEPKQVETNGLDNYF